MKGGSILGGMLIWLFANHAVAQQSQQAGLKGEYYNGTSFEHKVLTRIDPQLNFTWKIGSPATGLDRSYYSIRWTGQLLAPVSGKYTFNAKVDDGIRIWVGNRKVMDVWKLNDSGKFTGSIELKAGQLYDLRVDYFNDMLGGVIELYWVRPDAEKPFLKFGEPIGELIAPRYFRLPAPPGAALPKPVATPPVVASVAVARTTSKLPLSANPGRKPSVAATSVAVKPPVSNSVISTKPVATTVIAVAAPVVVSSAPALVERKPTILQHVQFEQSSYILLPESLPELDALIQTLRTNPNWHIELDGHTDNVGDPRLNKTLSEYRARVVMNYLTRHGIAEDRITTTGYGGSRPIASNDTEANRARNRRVEFVVK
ncbi:OmpA family protein [Fibrella forsythiae]|uniref:OmpA family protein n=1 Tax=Fibrella forsythiae TaxID=2817061 RepID=A0ABS3JEG4_9BACT|nr:PA14 domain-containing protein [Fibrella forsythiae]MBO0948383.1 OmpA family protein [Fibrella forsythiae]